MKYSKSQKNNFGKGEIINVSQKGKSQNNIKNKSKKYRSHLDNENRYDHVDEILDTEIVNEELNRKTNKESHIINNFYNESPKEYFFYRDWFDVWHLIIYTIFVVVWIIYMIRVLDYL